MKSSILILILFLSFSISYGNESINSDTLKKDTLIFNEKQNIEKKTDSIIMPRFDVHLNLVDLLGASDFGIRFLLIKELSFEYGIGDKIMITLGDPRFYRYWGINFHFPFYYNLALSYLEIRDENKYDSHSPNYNYHISKYITLGYIPMLQNYYQFNFKIGASIDYFLYNQTRKRSERFMFEIGYSFNFPYNLKGIFEE